MDPSTIIESLDENCVSNVLIFVEEILRAKQNEEAAQEFREACAKYTSSQDTPAVVRELMRHADVILAHEDESDVEAAFQGILCIIFPIQYGEHAQDLISEMISTLTADPNSNPQRRLKILVNLLNLLPSEKDRYRVALATFSFAGECGRLQLIAQHSDRVEAWCRAWQLELNERRRLYEVLATVFGRTTDRKKTQHFLTKYLETFDEETESAIQSVHDVATQLVLSAIKSPTVEVQQRSRVLKLKSVQQLSLDPTTRPLIELLQILCDKGIPEFTAFRTQYLAIFEERGLSPADCERSVQLLMMCDELADKQQIPYSVVASALGVPEDDVESWVVLAISEGLLEARMDQFTNILDISRCVRRTFGVEQWQDVRQRLHAWRENLRSLVQTMHQTTVN